MWEDTWCRIIFPKPFERAPKVFLTVNDDIQRHCHLQAEYIVPEEFGLRIIKTASGQPVERTVAWLAMEF